MTFNEWLIKYGFVADGYYVYVGFDSREARIEAFALSDYAVSSVSGPGFWFRPK